MMSSEKVAEVIAKLGYEAVDALGYEHVIWLCMLPRNRALRIIDKRLDENEAYQKLRSILIST